MAGLFGHKMPHYELCLGSILQCREHYGAMLVSQDLFVKSLGLRSQGEPESEKGSRSQPGTRPAKKRRSKRTRHLTIGLIVSLMKHSNHETELSHFSVQVFQVEQPHPPSNVAHPVPWNLDYQISPLDMKGKENVKIMANVHLTCTCAMPSAKVFTNIKLLNAWHTLNELI